VSEYVAEPPGVTRDYCPECEPSSDPLRELLIVRWCHRHTPSEGGTADEQVKLEHIPTGCGEGEAANCRAAQAIIT
jgi:hypothetical protein